MAYESDKAKKKYLSLEKKDKENLQLENSADSESDFAPCTSISNASKDMLASGGCALVASTIDRTAVDQQEIHDICESEGVQ